MAEDPNDIANLFYTKNINKAGCYLVYFYINGVRRGVIIDDYLPCKNGKPVFAQSRESELWVNLLEKAWAKLHGNYQRVEGGLPCHASCHVAGVPSRSIRHKAVEDANEFKSLIKFCDENQYTMIAATYGQGEGVDGNGIVAGHAYSLISCHEVKDEGKPVTLVRLRNPWGRGEWKGDWSDKSSKWTPQLKQQLGFQDADDGLFFMNINEYKEIFQSTSFCMTNDPVYKHSTLYHRMINNCTAYFQFMTTKPVGYNKTCFGIQVCQQGPRLQHYRDESSKFDPSRFSIVLMTESGKYLKGYSS